MNTRIAQTFARLQAEREAALIPYLTVGYPSVQATKELITTACESGADLIELGVPFSDPMADGATVQRASHAALLNGVSLATCLKLASQARQEAACAKVPFLFMSYYNPVHKFGIERCAESCAASGVDGLIIPDLPPEEAEPLRTACECNGLDLIFLVAPTSTDERFRRVAAMASGFIYCVSLTGVTGARSELGPGAAGLVARVRRYTDLPLAVGFGISRPEHVGQVARAAQGAVVGSALINLIEAVPGSQMQTAVANYLRELKDATRQEVAV